MRNMQSDIRHKESKITQLNVMNMRLTTHNNYLIELRTKERMTDSKAEDQGSKGQKGNRAAEEYKGQRKRQKYNHEVKKKTKYQWHEKGRCSKQDCKYSHPAKVCTDYNQGYCVLGDRCAENHPKRECAFWTRGNCRRGDGCNLKHTTQRLEDQPQKGEMMWMNKKGNMSPN